MQITETNAEGLTRKYEVVVAAQDIEQRVQRRLGELAKSVRLPGFRPGKVPVSVVKQRFGQSVLGEVLEQTVNDTSAETLKDRKLRPALQPKIEITSFEQGQDLVYAMQVEVLPEIDNPDLTGVALERLTPEIADAELDEALQRLAERYRKIETVGDGSAAATGDIVVIDFTGTIDGVEFAGGSGKGQPVELGSGRFIPGFEDQIRGAHAGDHVTVEVDFPADYGAEHLAGKAAHFEVEVKELKRKLPAAIDDSLADEVGMENLQALRDAVRGQMAADYDRIGRQRMKRDLLDQLAARHSFEVPPGMVEIELASIWKQYEEERERARQDGTYQPEEGKSEDDLKAEYRMIAERRVRLGLLLAEIGRHANIQVTPDEVSRAVTTEARRFPGQEKAVLDYYKAHPDAMQALRAPIYEDKVVDHIFEHAAVTEKRLPTKEFLAAAQLDDEADEAEDDSAAEPAPAAPEAGAAARD